MRQWLITCLFSLGCAASAPAWSASPAAQARAEVGPFKWSVFDANPNDGLEPSITFIDATNALRSLAEVYIYKIGDDDDSQMLYDSAAAFSSSNDLRPSAATKTVTSGQNHSGAGIVATPNGNGALLSVGRVFDKGLGFVAYSGISSSGSEFLSPTFHNLILGPGTGITLSTSAKLQVLLEVGRGEFAVALVDLLAEFQPVFLGNFDEKYASQQFEEQFVQLDSDVSSGWFVSDTIRYRENEVDLTISYENRADYAEIGRFRVSAYAYGEALPIPEPGSAFLLVLGMTALGWRIRGNRSVRPAGRFSSKS